MKRTLNTIMVCLAALCLIGLGYANENKAKPGELTGTWEGMAYGTSTGDLPITLELNQQGTEVTGWLSTSGGTVEITSGTFKKGKLEFHLETPETDYVATAELRKGELRGEWTSSTGEKGTWDAEKQSPPKK